MRILTLFAVAALAATAMCFPAQNSALAYCRGCVIEPAAAKAALASADASSLPVIKVQCHTERQMYRKNGQQKFRRVEVCE
jgi:hypothetical protein